MPSSEYWKNKYPEEMKDPDWIVGMFWSWFKFGFIIGSIFGFLIGKSIL